MAEMNGSLGYNYYAIVLTEESKKQLMQLCCTNESFDYLYEETSKVYCDHCTIMHNSKHNPYIKEYLDTKLGKEFTMEVIAIGYDDKALAARLSRGWYITQLCTNDIPHITIGTFDGGKPVDSNFTNFWKGLEQPIILKGILKKL